MLDNETDCWLFSCMSMFDKTSLKCSLSTVITHWHKNTSILAYQCHIVLLWCFLFQLKGPLLKEQREKKLHTHKISVREYVPLLSVHKLISDVITCWQTALCQFYLLSNLSLTVLSADRLTSHNIICQHINTWLYYRLTNVSLTLLPVGKLISASFICYQSWLW